MHLLKCLTRTSLFVSIQRLSLRGQGDEQLLIANRGSSCSERKASQGGGEDKKCERFSIVQKYLFLALAGVKGSIVAHISLPNLLSNDF